jgi:hypothetical protein
LNGTLDDRIAELERAVAAAPGGPAFAALAELHRRAGRLDEAERVALAGLAAAPDSAASRAVLALILADAGRQAELRRCLEAWAERAVAAFAPSPVLLPGADALEAGFVAAEIDRAFEGAAPDREAMITPDKVAEEAALGVDGPYAVESPLEVGGAFATRTMAELLERQGDHEAAARIRASLEDPPEVSASGPVRERDGADPAPSATIAVLERWLENARRMQT